jgi:serine/threonine-protein kinase
VNLDRAEEQPVLQRVAAGNGVKGQDGYPLTLLAPETVLNGVYRVHSFHKLGGMSATYRVTRDGAIYLLKEVPCSDSKGVISLNQERFTLDRLDHPGIVKARDLFEEEGYYYLVLEFIEGQGLETAISPLPDSFLGEKIVLDWALQLCDIFEYLHAQSPPVIYRDLKPRNVIKSGDRRLVLVDFGIARVFKESKSQDTESMGSAITASPEHYGISQTDARSDIYTLGATLHYLLSNGRGPDEPFRFQPIRNLNPNVSKRLEAVLEKSLAIDPAQRYQTMAQMRQALLNSRRDPLPLVEPLGPPAGPKAQSSSPLDAPARGADRPGLAWALVAILSVVVLAMAFRNTGGQRVTALAASPSPASSVPPMPAPSDLQSPPDGSQPGTGQNSPAEPSATARATARQDESPPPPLAELAAAAAAPPPPIAEPSEPAPSRRHGGPQEPGAGAHLSDGQPDYPRAAAVALRQPEGPGGSLLPPELREAVPADYHLVFQEPGHFRFQASQPGRSLELFTETGGGGGVRALGKQRMGELGTQGVWARDQVNGRLRSRTWTADYQQGGEQVRELIWAWPRIPEFLHAVYRAPQSAFASHAGDLEALKQALGSPEAPDTDERPRRAGRGRARLSSPRRSGGRF